MRARVDLEPDCHQNQWGLCDALFSNYFEDLLTSRAARVDAQPTVNEAMTCSASTPETVVNIFRTIASNQQENTKEIKDEIRLQIDAVKKQLASKPCDAVDPSKSALVSALECEYRVCFQSENSGSSQKLPI